MNQRGFFQQSKNHLVLKIKKIKKEEQKTDNEDENLQETKIKKRRLIVKKQTYVDDNGLEIE